MKKVLLGVMLLVFCGLSMEAAERMTVAWLPPRNASGDTNTAHWKYAIDLLIHAQLFEVKSIRLLPHSSIDYAFRQLKLKDDQALNPEQARTLGETIEARRVVWSEYKQEGKKYTLTLQVVTVASGEASKKLTFSGPDWFQVVSNGVNGALHELAVAPTPEEEERRMNFPPTRSMEALELFAQGAAAQHAFEPLSKSEPLFRKAASVDPTFTTPQVILAFDIFMGQNRADAAERIAKQAVQARSDYPVSHYVLGYIYLMEGMSHIARDELLEAVRLDPDDPQSYEQLGEIYSAMGKFDDAIAAWKQALLLVPYGSKAHAYLANAYAIHGNRDQALGELRKAEHFDPGNDPDVDNLLADAYETLKDVPHCVERLEKVVSTTRQMGADNQMFKDKQTKLAYWKESLSPHFITASAPRAYSREELDRALKAKLMPSEFQSTTNPLTSTLEMKRWAVELTAGATNEQQKAKRLFEGTLLHLDGGNWGGKRTAEQTFGAWKQPGIFFVCQEYALLYVTLAREVGLKAWVTLITKDCEGRNVPHACAGVFIGDQVLLVDPAYQWFGAPHQEYEFLDDIQMISLYLCQLRNLESKRIAAKLRPDFAIARFNYAMYLSELDRLKEARKELEAGLMINSNSPMALVAQGLVEANERNLDAAAEHLGQGLELAVGFDDCRYALAQVLHNQGKLLEAREQFRKYLEGLTEPEMADSARKAIIQINESLADSKSPAPQRFKPLQEIK